MRGFVASKYGGSFGPMMRATVAIAMLLLSGCAQSTLQVRSLDSPLVEPSMAEGLKRAVSGIRLEVAGLVDRDVTPEGLDWNAFGASNPFAAFDVARYQLAEVRVRAGLQVHGESSVSRLEAAEVKAWLADYLQPLVENANLLAGPVMDAAVPSDGPGLEDLLFRYLPPFRVLSSEGTLTRLLGSIEEGENGTDLHRVLPIIVGIEADRVSWEFLPPQTPVLDPGVPKLSMERVQSLWGNASRLGSTSSYMYRDAQRLASQELTLEHEFGALVFGAVAEQAALREAYLGKELILGGDIAADLEGEYRRLGNGTRSTLSLHAQAIAYYIMQGTVRGAALNETDAESISGALANYGVVHWLRGQSRPQTVP